MVRTLSVEPKGQFLASGSDDGTVKIWEIQTGYCHKTFVFGKTIITSVAWCPNTSLSLLAVAFENKVSRALKQIFTKVVPSKPVEGRKYSANLPGFNNLEENRKGKQM